ncbi:hypothetical protein LCGC14_3148830 [marine sediment metagenome]|uniref:Uncharacterized protein n=1 Tax=marine sediment metagenome TaxID=412755 RepID=A0A0F8WIM9_9ZZZZ
MAHKPEKHLERAGNIARIAIQMYQAGKISHSHAMDRFERALGHVDIYNAEKATRTD